jgi:hypothetical protein
MRMRLIFCGDEHRIHLYHDTERRGGGAGSSEHGNETSYSLQCMRFP